uniref:Uncharacterized protein n=1 Tax=Globisporangium ultimum (strain ATCC 200006 / CBS 805.95 / DAOM BR144) TaxID=431595 RepID=K3W6E5_GLOUD
MIGMRPKLLDMRCVKNESVITSSGWLMNSTLMWIGVSPYSCMKKSGKKLIVMPAPLLMIKSEKKSSHGTWRKAHVLARKVAFFHVAIFLCRKQRRAFRGVLPLLAVVILVVRVLVVDLKLVAHDRRREQRLLDLLLRVLLLGADVLVREVVVEAQQQQRRDHRQHRAELEHGLELLKVPRVAVVQEQQDADRRAEDHREVAHVVLDHKRERALAVRDRVGEERLHGGALQSRKEAPERKRDVEQVHDARLDGIEREHGCHDPDRARELEDRVAAGAVGKVACGEREHELRDALDALDHAHGLVRVREHEHVARDHLLEQDAARGPVEEREHVRRLHIVRDAAPPPHQHRATGWMKTGRGEVRGGKVAYEARRKLRTGVNQRKRYVPVMARPIRNCSCRPRTHIRAATSSAAHPSSAWPPAVRSLIFGVCDMIESAL